MVLRLHAGQPSPVFRTSLRKRIHRATFFSRKTATSIVERHARSEKLMKENRLKVILNSDGEIENMDEETHAERHARTVALAQANGRLRFKPVSKSVNASLKDCSKMVIPHASNDNKTQIVCSENSTWIDRAMVWYRWFSGSMRASRDQRSEQAYKKEFVELPSSPERLPPVL